ncbi:Sas10/Utp3/C1D family-domain-containing protein [Clohesyomyces aquaticus]|uniref:Sas10/Utp3/C1D family-domain-containing protein n=1 Tax=Clohesyomyces aquaticus TaxID=1231657 RepID=A0A1Y1ZB52_9PLEO|nr:Sas10/Utp3/C1D family-domain-containing protein [Clohesyomyces aquaticus]
MAIDNSLTSLLATLTTSIESATGALPDDSNIIPPKEGISLLDVKNELLLSYLQNLVFLVLLKLRSQTASDSEEQGKNDVIPVHDEVIKKLVEFRVYLEKGVRPLENRLKYQIDKIVRAADDVARNTVQVSRTSTAEKSKDHATSGSGASDAGSAASAQTDEDLDDIAYGPNRSAFVRPKAIENKTAKDSSKDGIYRPPRITPMSMPTTMGREEKGARRSGKSATLDEFVATEMSTAPMVEPSIGSTIVSGGRRTKSDRERREEAERRDYEESNFVRLPKESKKDRAKKGHSSRDGGWGGEEWRGLGAGLDRIERLTQKKGGALGSLEKSRKRPISDGPRGTGSQAGEMFEKRRKVVSRYRK